MPDYQALTKLLEFHDCMSKALKAVKDPAALETIAEPMQSAMDSRILTTISLIETRMAPFRRPHRKTGWVWCEEFGVWIRDASPIIEEACLGDRIIVRCPGELTRMRWKGSTPDSWLSQDFDNDFDSALYWVKETEYPSIGYYLWGTREGELLAEKTK